MKPFAREDAFLRDQLGVNPEAYRAQGEVPSISVVIEKSILGNREVSVDQVASGLVQQLAHGGVKQGGNDASFFPAGRLLISESRSYCTLLTIFASNLKAPDGAATAPFTVLNLSVPKKKLQSHPLVPMLFSGYPEKGNIARFPDPHEALRSFFNQAASAIGRNATGFYLIGSDQRPTQIPRVVRLRELVIECGVSPTLDHSLAVTGKGFPPNDEDITKRSLADSRSIQA